MRKVIALLFLSVFFLLSVSAQDCKNARILGATYGPADVTSKVAHSYNTGAKSIAASNSNFGDSLPGVSKTLTVVYEICSNVAMVIAKEGEMITIA